MRSTFTQNISDYKTRTVDKCDLSKRPIASTWGAAWNKINLQQPPPLLVSNSDQPAAYSFPWTSCFVLDLQSGQIQVSEPSSPHPLSLLQMHP